MHLLSDDRALQEISGFGEIREIAAHAGDEVDAGLVCDHSIHSRAQNAKNARKFLLTYTHIRKA